MTQSQSNAESELETQKTKRDRRRAPDSNSFATMAVDMEGRPPGEFSFRPDEPTTTLMRIDYGPHGAEIVGEVDLAGALAPSDYPITWINAEGLGDPAVILPLANALHMHPLALEDAVVEGQRCKHDPYAEHHFILVPMPYINEERVIFEQLGVFIYDDKVITLQGGHEGDCLTGLRRRIETGKGRVRSRGTDFLAYAILDKVVDAYAPIVRFFAQKLEDIEDLLMQGSTSVTLNRLNEIKGRVRELLRVVTPVRDTVRALVRAPDAPFSEDTRVYLRDCRDHAEELVSSLIALRDWTANLTDLSLAVANQKMTEQMGVLTIIATIFIPLTFVAGVYGMNFDREVSPYNMPELGMYYGYPAIWGVMLLMAVGMFLWFRHRGWFR